MRGESPFASRRLSRRTFLTGAAIGGVSVAAGVMPSARAGVRAAGSNDIDPLRATIPQLRRLIGEGDLTSRDLTELYLKRIERLNPLLHAVIEVNPDALLIADRRDEQARSMDDDDLGPLHGIPSC